MELNLFRGWTPRVSQRKILESRSRFIMVGGPVGPGKTTGMLWKIFWLCLNFARNFGVLGRWVEEHLYETTIPSWKELFPIEEFGHVMRYVGGDREPRAIEIAARDPNNPEVLSWDCCSTINLVPLSASKRLPGGQLGFFGIEQAEQCPDASTWTDLMRRMRRKCIPYTDQHGMATANYEANWDWCHELFIEHKIENVPLPPDEAAKFEFIEATGAETDQNFGEAYRKEQMAVLPPLKAKMLIQGINVRTLGRVYKDWNEEVHVREFEFAEVAKERGGLSWVMSYDYGMDPDPTVVILVGVDRAGRLWIRSEHVKTDMTIKDTEKGPGHETHSRNMASRTGFPIDSSDYIAGHDIFGKQHTGGTIADEWSRDFPWRSNRVEIATRIERVMYLLAKRPPKQELPEELDLPLIIVHPECEMTRYGFAHYKYADDGSGKPMKRQTPGVKDTMDAVGMAALAAVEPRAPRSPLSSILTPDSYKVMCREVKRGRAVGYWIPIPGVPDPATERPSPRAF